MAQTAEPITVRRLLVRSMGLALGAALAVLVVPMVLLLTMVANLPAREVEDVLGSGLSIRVWLIRVVVITTLTVIAAGTGLLVIRRQVRRIAEPLALLTDRAERLGAGESRLQALESGVEEIDRISRVLSRSSQQVARNLASERDFAADASHQLRTPLTALLMRLEEISVTDDLEVVAEEANVAIGQVERLSGVVDDLLTRSRRSTKHRPSVSLDTVLASMQREWQPAFAAARRSMHVHGERGLRVRATPVALSQMLSTLVENALSHGRGTVEVAARRSGPSVVIELSDQGDGIPMALAPHIFERSVSSTGSGLGLSLARDLAEANGGRLELVSAQPAVFAIFLSEAED